MLSTILDFIYTGQLKMTNENALDLFIFADRMELQALFTSCAKYIESHIDAQNCLGIQRIAERYNQTSLDKYAGSYLLRNFQKFADTEDFLELTTQELLTFLWKDELNIEREEYLIEYVFRWIEHQPEARFAELENMMRSLRYPLMNFDFIEGRFRNDPRWKNNKAILKLVKTIYKGCFQIFHRITNNPYPALPCLKQRYRFPSQVIFMYGGWNRGRTLDTTECYNIKTGSWYPANHLRDESSSEGRCYFGIECVNGIIYMTGGFDGRSYLNTIRTFNPITREWAGVTPMHYRRCFTTAVALGTDLYVLAGFDGVRRLTTVEKYCTVTRQWTVVASLNEQRSDGSAVVHNGKMYIFGGYAGDALNSAEVYSVETDSWSRIASMRTKRSGASAVSIPGSNKIMVLGGYNGSTRVASVELYDTETNTWTPGPSMSQERSNFATCTLENKLYVMGGYTGSTTLRDVEIFDLTDNTWQFGRPINAGRSAMKAVCIDITKAEDYFDQLNDMAHQQQHTENNELYELNSLLSSSDSNQSQ